MPPIASAHQIEQALRAVKDQSSFIQRLLIDALQWPIDESAAEVNDIAYYWSQDELRAEGLNKDLVDGRIWQIQPLTGNQPWGIFLLEFKRPDAFVTGRGMVGPLRKVLRGLVPSHRKVPGAKSWNREHLLFFCTYKYEHYRVGYFKSPPDKKTAPPLFAFGWGHSIPARTACEFNLPHLAWPDDSSPDAWIAQWKSAFDVEKVTKEFYQELSNWYFWARGKVRFPKDAPKDDDGHDSLSLIRLVTRMIFCWFVKEKGLIPATLFDPDEAPALLNEYDAKSSSYYQAILQNLFFATLNQEMDKREFRRDRQHFMAHNLYRYRRLLKDPDRVLKLFATIPFMNGGLFECLDKHLGTKEKPKYVRIDGFSDRDDSQLCVPNELFFAREHSADLRDAYGEAKYRSAPVRGLIHTLNRYKFTLTENTPLEQEVALDPELLGKVFENLLAAYNPETGATARKQTGSFYTPRQIVDYMVDESLVASFKSKFGAALAGAADVDQRLRHLLAYNDEAHQFTPAEVDVLIQLIDHVKILDPACGSGAFPMGVLHKLVFALAKLDPRNERWKARQIAKAEELPDPTVRTKALDDIEEAFNANELDYGRKLYLIENCIYGVDIQPIAVQISKLRCFISLIVDQRKDDRADNLGIRPLPNLETNFVAANSLVPVARPRQRTLRNPQIERKERELHRVRDRHFSARTPVTKAKCRDEDARLRAEIAELLEGDGWDHTAARQLAAWDPYDQNASAVFFDTEWMFGIKVGKILAAGKGAATLAGRFAFVNQLPGQMELVEPAEIDSGFDVVIGNPPYVRIQTLKQQDSQLVAFYREHYQSAKKGNYDVYVVFVEAGLSFLRRDGNLAFILPHKFFNAQYGESLRAHLAKGKHLRHVVHFGDQQVFPGATNYVCLLFLTKYRSDECRFARADDLSAWLSDRRTEEAQIPADRLTPAEWNFAVGKGVGLFDKLQRMAVKLGDIASRISQGIRTSANEVYVLDVIHENAGLITAYSKQLEREVVVERKAVLRFLQGREIKAFSITPSGKAVLMPYKLVAGRMALPSAKEFRASFPKAWDYLLTNQAYLEAREGGKMRHDGWYGFVYPKNLEVMFASKIVVPDIADRAAFALDEDGDFAFTSGYGITLNPGVELSQKYLLALLNSRLLDYYWKQVSTPLQGSFFRYFTQYIAQLPIQRISLRDKGGRAQHDALAGLTDRILMAKRTGPGTDTHALEREIDERVYRLYCLTPEEIKFVDNSSVRTGNTSTRASKKSSIESLPFS